jgi:hypothetical protein
MALATGKAAIAGDLAKDAKDGAHHGLAIVSLTALLLDLFRL